MNNYYLNKFIDNGFYHHLADYTTKLIKLFNMDDTNNMLLSNIQILRKIKYRNPSLMILSIKLRIMI